MKKKLLIFLPSLAGGGAERTIVNIVNYIDKKVFEVVLVMVSQNISNENRHEYLEQISPNVKVKYLNCKLSKYNIAKIIYKLTKAINQEKPDIVFSTTLNANLITVISNKLSKSKRPVIIRETTNRTQLNSGRFNKLITKLVYNQADMVVSLSNGVKEDLIDNFKVDGSKICVIYNPIDLLQINNSKLEPVESLRVSEDIKSIITVGRLIDAKDQTVLLKAFNKISKKINSRLLILGKGPEEEKLKQLCKELKIDEKVHFLGFHKNPYKYINLSDLFVLTSKREGFGHVIVEAMALGVPVISTDCKSGPSEIILNNKFGKLVKVGDYDKLADESIKLLSNSKECKELSELGLKRAADFRANKIVKEYQKLFINVLNR